VIIQRYKTDEYFSALVECTSEMDCELVEIDKLLEDEKLFVLLQTDLSQRYRLTTKTGRHSTPVEVILRMLVLKHLRGLSYKQTVRNVKETLVLRQFCRVYLNRVPDKSMLIRWSKLIKPDTLKQFNERLLEMARQLKLTKGRKMRTDGTVVETNIHYPTDSSLLADGVRVLSRTLVRAKALLKDKPQVNPNLFRNRNRTAKRTARRINEQLRRRGKDEGVQAKKAYQQLVRITKASIKQATTVQALLEELISPQAKRLVKILSEFVPRIEQVIDQTCRRIFGQEKLAATSKLLSLFEAHSDIICRGKLNRTAEFGHKVWLCEVDGGLISDYRVLCGNPHDTLQWSTSLEKHIEQFGRAPLLASADRGVYSQPNETIATQKGVKRVILPKSGYKSKQRQQQEKQPSFRRGRYWHNGVEGRISVLKRCYGLRRCLYYGEIGFERWLGWGVIAGNLAVMARALVSPTQLRA